MDRIRDIRPPGSPHAPFKAPPLAAWVLERGVAGRNACLIWTGYVDPEGYGKAKFKGRLGYAHRFAYEALIGPIPEGMQIDHVCHSMDAECKAGDNCVHRRCINPGHLEPVTPRENSRRSNKGQQTHCLHGHPFDAANTYMKSNGTRRCRECQRAWGQRYQAKRKAGIQ